MVEREARGNRGREYTSEQTEQLSHEAIVRGVREYVVKEQQEYRAQISAGKRIPSPAELIRKRLDSAPQNAYDTNEPLARMLIAWDIVSFDHYPLKTRSYGRSLANLTDWAQQFKARGEKPIIGLNQRESHIINALAEVIGIQLTDPREFAIPEKFKDGWGQYWHSPEHQARLKAAGFNPCSEACDL